MMKKKVMPLSCLMAAAMLAGCGTAAPAVSEKTTAPAAETAEAAQKTAPADAAESEAAAMEETAGVWKVEPCYNFDEIVPLYSEWDHTAGKNAEATVTVTDGSAAPDTPSVDTPSTDNKAAETPAAAGAPSAAAAVSTAPVDTRTAQQREIDEAKANGTWGIEYTTCQKCGYHNWTRKGNVYVCDTCGNETTTVVSAKGVKGYVGSGAIAPVANKAAAPETRYANAKQAQAAADAREAAYAAAVAAFQKQIAANEAAYLAAIAK